MEAEREDVVAIVNVDRPVGAEPTEMELLLQEAFEIALWRRQDWTHQVSRRLVHCLALLNGMPLDSFSGIKKVVDGGLFKATIEPR